MVKSGLLEPREQALKVSISSSGSQVLGNGNSIQALLVVSVLMAKESHGQSKRTQVISSN